MILLLEFSLTFTLASNRGQDCLHLDYAPSQSSFPCFRVCGWLDWDRILDVKGQVLVTIVPQCSAWCLACSVEWPDGCDSCQLIPLGAKAAPMGLCLRVSPVASAPLVPWFSQCHLVSMERAEGLRPGVLFFLYNEQWEGVRNCRMRWSQRPEVGQSQTHSWATLAPWCGG
jgi:hypothetical protein